MLIKVIAKGILLSTLHTGKYTDINMYRVFQYELPLHLSNGAIADHSGLLLEFVNNFYEFQKCLMHPEK